MAFSQKTQETNKNSSSFIIGRVLSIVLGPYIDNKQNENTKFSSFADIGKINFEILYKKGNSNATNNFAWPINTFVKQYPVVGELVLIIPGPSDAINDKASNQKLFYMSPYAVWNSPNHNAFPDIANYSNYLEDFVNKQNYQQDGLNNIEYPKGYQFKEKNIRALSPFEGDSIIEGRFGQSIRFGSTNRDMSNYNTWSNYGKTGDPILIIRNGEGRVINQLDPFATTIENINIDPSSIYLTNGQEIILEDLNNFPKQSYGITVNNLQQPITKIYSKPISNDSIAADQQDSNSL